MEKEQQKEWNEAQKIPVSVDLVEAAKKQLKFLATVDRNRHLYEDHALQWAIYRYNAFWLPLVAKHLENPVCEGPLVVPLDCEWIWHCHRLNPIRYKLDCEKLYGRILTNHNVVSSVHTTSKGKSEEIWKKMYLDEPYELDTNRSFSVDVLKNEKFPTYDLISAVKRQISFTFQVSRPHMSDDVFLQEAVARYKGFLHLIRTNKKMRIDRFCVPTYDVDLMWHTHQLHPYYYCKDMIKILGMVLQHDDTDSDRSKGSQLDTGFSETTRQWEETFGLRYWKAGAMYRGNAPTPVTDVPSEVRYKGKEIKQMENCDLPIQLPVRKAMEVIMEFVEIKNLPEGYKDNLVVTFSKKESDKLFKLERSLTVFSVSGEKQVAYFRCEPKGDFLFELKSESSKVVGSCSLSLQELLDSPSQLFADKWLSVNPVSDLLISEPILLRVAVSFTPPIPASQVFHLKQSHKQARAHTDVTDDEGNAILSLLLTNTVKDETKITPELLKAVYYITGSGEEHQVAEFLNNNWVIKGIHGGPFMLQKNSGNGGHLFDFVGNNKLVKLFSGRRLEFEPSQCASKRPEEDFITAVEFSVLHPYGKAITLCDLKLGTIKAEDDLMVIPGLILGVILLDIRKREKVNAGVTDVISRDAGDDAENGSSSCGGGVACRGGCVGAALPKIAENGSSSCGGVVACRGGCVGAALPNVADNSGSSCGGKCSGKCHAGGCGGAALPNVADNSGSSCGGKCSGKCHAGGCGGATLPNIAETNTSSCGGVVACRGGGVGAALPNAAENGSSSCDGKCRGGGCGGKCGGGGCGGGCHAKAAVALQNVAENVAVPVVANVQVADVVVNVEVVVVVGAAMPKAASSSKDLKIMS